MTDARAARLPGRPRRQRDRRGRTAQRRRGVPRARPAAARSDVPVRVASRQRLRGACSAGSSRARATPRAVEAYFANERRGGLGRARRAAAARRRPASVDARRGDARAPGTPAARRGSRCRAPAAGDGDEPRHLGRRHRACASTYRAYGPSGRPGARRARRGPRRAGGAAHRPRRRRAARAIDATGLRDAARFDGARGAAGAGGPPAPGRPHVDTGARRRQPSRRRALDGLPRGASSAQAQVDGDRDRVRPGPRGRPPGRGPRRGRRRARQRGRRRARTGSWSSAAPADATPTSSPRWRAADRAGGAGPTAQQRAVAAYAPWLLAEDLARTTVGPLPPDRPGRSRVRRHLAARPRARLRLGARQRARQRRDRRRDAARPTLSRPSRSAAAGQPAALPGRRRPGDLGRAHARPRSTGATSRTAGSCTASCARSGASPSRSSSTPTGRCCGSPSCGRSAACCWRRSAAGSCRASTPDQAYRVTATRRPTPPERIDAGQVVCEIDDRAGGADGVHHPAPDLRRAGAAGGGRAVSEIIPALEDPHPRLPVPGLARPDRRLSAARPVGDHHADRRRAVRARYGPVGASSRCSRSPRAGATTTCTSCRCATATRRSCSAAAWSATPGCSSGTRPG